MVESSSFEADCLQQFVQAGSDTSIETVELRTFGILQDGVGSEWLKETGSKGSVYALEKFQEEHANGVALGGAGDSAGRKGSCPLSPWL